MSEKKKNDEVTCSDVLQSVIHNIIEVFEPVFVALEAILEAMNVQLRQNMRFMLVERYGELSQGQWRILKAYKTGLDVASAIAEYEGSGELFVLFKINDKVVGIALSDCFSHTVQKLKEYAQGVGLNE